MNLNRIVSYLLIVGTAIVLSCVERINFALPRDFEFPVVIAGFISDNPGPYQVTIHRAFDIDSRENKKVPQSARKVTLFDNMGKSEVLTEVDKGFYLTSKDGIRGIVGRAYHLEVELLSGEIFESEPDTLRGTSGRLDSVYAVFTKINTGEPGPPRYTFDINFDATTSNYPLVMWNMTATFKVATQPEFDKEQEPCSSDIDCHGCNICNLVWKCSGLRNIGTASHPIYVRVAPCTCCTCWYNIFNEYPILPILLPGTINSSLKGQTAGNIPVNNFTFQHNVHVEVRQFTLSARAFAFYKAVRDQHMATSSLFQPVTGKIPGNFTERNNSGNVAYGLFYAAGLTRKVIVVRRQDIPQGTFMLSPQFPPPIVGANCLRLLPNATNREPVFWTTELD